LVWQQSLPAAEAVGLSAWPPRCLKLEPPRADLDTGRKAFMGIGLELG
jgi:hypothetical protein